MKSEQVMEISESGAYSCAGKKTIRITHGACIAVELSEVPRGATVFANSNTVIINGGEKVSVMVWGNADIRLSNCTDFEVSGSVNLRKLDAFNCHGLSVTVMSIAEIDIAYSNNVRIGLSMKSSNGHDEGCPIERILLRNSMVNLNMSSRTVKLLTMPESKVTASFVACKFRTFEVSSGILVDFVFRECEISSISTSGGHCHRGIYERCRIGQNHTTSHGISYNCTDNAHFYKQPGDLLRELGFEFTSEGMIGYKIFATDFAPPNRWDIALNSVIEEFPNNDIGDHCAGGINLGSPEWMKTVHAGYKFCHRLLVKNVDLPGLIVPIGGEGKVRASRVTILGQMRISDIPYTKKAPTGVEG